MVIWTLPTLGFFIVALRTLALAEMMLYFMFVVLLLVFTVQGFVANSVVDRISGAVSIFTGVATMYYALGRMLN